MSLVQFKDVDLTYKSNDFKTLDKLNLEIKDGEFIVVVGPSGCGKTSTLKILSGLEDITGGELIINGEVVNYKEPKDRDISMVFQNYALYPHFTVEKNISFGLKKLKLSKQEIKTRTDEVAEMLGITDQMSKMPKDLSGGQQQRVALARAIVREPLIYIFDEPLSNLDAKLRTKTRQDIVNMHKTLKKTFFYVTHDQIEAMTMADRIIVLKDGIVQQFDRPINIFYNPKNLFIAKFMGTPEMNTFKLDIKDGNLVFDEENKVKIDSNSKLFIGDRKLIHFGIRPDEINYSFNAEEDMLKVQVVGREILGNQTILNTEIAGESLNVVIKTKEFLESIEHIYVRIDTKCGYFFDVDSELNLNVKNI